WEPDVNTTRNKVSHEILQLSDKQGKPLQPGYYFIGVTAKPLDYKSRFYQGFLFIVATNNITLKTTEVEGSAWVTDLESGKPEPNVSVTFYDQHLEKIGSSLPTDKNGIAYLKGAPQPAFARVEGDDHLAFTAIDWGSGVWAGDFGL